jgi:hypothetical protein
MTNVRFPPGTRYTSAQKGFGGHLAFHPVGIEGSLTRGKVARGVKLTT